MANKTHFVVTSSTGTGFKVSDIYVSTDEEFEAELILQNIPEEKILMVTKAATPFESDEPEWVDMTYAERFDSCVGRVLGMASVKDPHNFIDLNGA